MEIFNGLTSTQAKEALEKYGPNKIDYFKIEILEIIKRNTLNFFNFLLLLAGILSSVFEGFGAETLIIFFFLILSISISIFQDYHSTKLAKKLLSYFKNYAWVKRDNQWIKIPQEEVVPKDYAKVSAGFLIPADIKILKNESCLIDESIITGESQPVYKKEGEIAHMGTMVVSGELEGEVVATGKNTYFGSIAKKTLEVHKETAYQKILDDFAKKIGYLGIGLIFLLILVNFLKPEPLEFKDILIFSIVLAVAVVPELLPAMTVLTLSLTGEKLAKKGLLIKRLSTLEDLGGVEILCADKTGTITTNELKLEKIATQDQKEFLNYFLLDYWFSKEITPYEKAVLEKIKSISKDTTLEVIEDVVFDPKTRVEKIIAKKGNEIIKIAKGAPEQVIEACASNDKEKEEWIKVFNQEDQNGFRTLALGIESPHKKILGIASFFDPLKEDSFGAVKLAKEINLEIKILTGDSPNVARKVALDLGIISQDDKVVLGQDLRKLSQENLKKVVLENKVFARVFPEDKLKIVEILQKEKMIAFLGEGVNDAPALKVVSSAIVVDSASDITKEEADIILRKKDLKQIVEGIYEGRKVLENIGKYLKHTMSGNFGNLISVSILASFIKFIPLTPIQVLLTNFLTDIPLIAFASDNVKTKEIKKPIKISNKKLILLLLILGLTAGLVNIAAYFLAKNESPNVIQTYIFYITTFSGLIVSFLIRTKDWFFLSKPSKNLIIGSCVASIITLIFITSNKLQSYFGFAILNQRLILWSLVLFIIFIILTEQTKRFFYKRFPDLI
jgi:Mg2+-importing ATPase